MASNNNIAFSTHKRIRAKMAEKKAKAEAREKLLEPFETMDGKALREYAEENNIDLGKLKTVKEIRAFIVEAVIKTEDAAEQLAAEKAEFEKMPLKELKVYAKNNEIDISDLSDKEDIRSRIMEFVFESASDEDDNNLVPVDNEKKTAEPEGKKELDESKKDGSEDEISDKVIEPETIESEAKEPEIKEPSAEEIEKDKNSDKNADS